MFSDTGHTFCGERIRLRMFIQTIASILVMFRAAKVLKSLLLTVGRPCLEPLKTLPATSLAVWRVGGVRGGLPLDSQGGRPAGAGALQG